jgi:hypothetical protein
MRWQPARCSRRSPPHAKALARTMSAWRLPGTSGPAALKSATENSSPPSQRSRRTGLRSDSGTEKHAVGCGRIGKGADPDADRLRRRDPVVPRRAARLSGRICWIDGTFFAFSEESQELKAHFLAMSGRGQRRRCRPVGGATGRPKGVKLGRPAPAL